MPGKVVGRDHELQDAAEFLDEIALGPSALTFAGAPGIGKTTLWEETIQRAISLGYLVLSARPAEAEAELAFAALADLLEPFIDTVLPGMTGPQRHAIAVALLREDPGPRPLDQRAVSAATMSVIRALAASVPVLLAIDDWQWLDIPTLRVLEFVLRRLSDAPVGVLACERVEADGESVPLRLDEASRSGRYRRVRLGPMTQQALHQVLEDHLGRKMLSGTVARLNQTARGNPFFAMELARLVPSDASNQRALPLPSSLRRVVEDRVAAVPAPARHALLTAAAMRTPTLDLVAAATPGRYAEALRALDGAAEVGVITIDGQLIRFAHPLYAAAVYSSATPEQRRLAHRRLARVVSQVEEHALHVALGARAVSEQLAAVVDAGAENARRRGAPEAAAELTEHAMALTPPGHSRQLQRRAIQAAEYKFHAGDLRGARGMLEPLLVEVTSGSVRADMLRLLGEIRFHEDSFFEAIRLFEEALQHTSDDPKLRAVVGLRLAFTTMATGDFESAARNAQQALILAEHAGEPGLLAEALAVSAMADVLTGHGLDQARIDHALQLEDLERNVPVQLRPSLIAGILALYAGQVERSERILCSLRERIIERGQKTTSPLSCATCSGRRAGQVPCLTQPNMPPSSWNQQLEWTATPPAARRWRSQRSPQLTQAT